MVEGLRVSGKGFGAFRVQDVEFRVQASGFRVQDLGFTGSTEAIISLSTGCGVEWHGRKAEFVLHSLEP